MPNGQKEEFMEWARQARLSLLDCESEHPGCLKLEDLHYRLEMGLWDFGRTFDLSLNEISTLAGGGTPKTRPPRR